MTTARIAASSATRAVAASVGLKASSCPGRRHLRRLRGSDGQGPSIRSGAPGGFKGHPFLE